jgi:S1-C subfamily serine protease
MDEERNLYDNLENGKSEENNNTTENVSTDKVNFIIRENEQKINGSFKKVGRKRRALGYIASVLVAALLGGLAGGYFVSYNLNTANQNKSDITKTAAQQININLSDNMYYAAAVAEKSSKSVVGITSEVTQSINTIFGPQTQKGQSMGSGFIVDPSGYILTNSHVIGDGEYENISVSLIDGTQEVGEVLWYDTSLDLAIVKINKTGLPAVEFADSDTLKVGEPVVAIGNPMTLDLERTVTDGIISGLNRSISFESGTVIEPLIQTDASINSGNSGGPLFNAEGKVIGINTAKMNSAEGLGFSIPINTAKPIIEQIIKNGKLSTVYVGIKGVDVETYETALGVDVSAEYGVVVVETVANSPASEAGLVQGDVIQYINSEKLTSMTDLKRQLYNYKEGDKVNITFLRDGKEKTVEMILKEKPEQF